jgi:hypothetical protein
LAFSLKRVYEAVKIPVFLLTAMIAYLLYQQMRKVVPIFSSELRAMSSEQRLGVTNAGHECPGYYLAKLCELGQFKEQKTIISRHAKGSI